MSLGPDADASPRGVAVDEPCGRNLLRDIVHGFRASQALFVAAQLRVADHLAHGPADRLALAAATGTNPDALGRVMRALCALGVFSEAADGQFSLSAPGHLLRSDIAGSYRSAVLLLAGATRWHCWSSLIDTVRTGVNAVERERGMQIFDFYAAHPAESAIHDDAMQALSANAAAIVRAIDVGAARTIVDVGGGTGELLATLLDAHPGVSGILFDLADVAQRAHAVLRRSSVAQRCRVAEGSFFETVPRGDLYLMKQVLHDWDDGRAVAILQCCRRHMPPDGRLLVIERQIPERAEAGISREAFMTDLEMLVMTPGGRERTETELRALFAAAGFRPVRTVPTTSMLCVFEAQPA
jgi:orsellinic acid C2-O-methyltransferase